MSRLSGGKGRWSRSVSVYELPDHQDQDASLRWARRRSGLKGVHVMTRHTETSAQDFANNSRWRPSLCTVNFLFLLLVAATIAGTISTQPAMALPTNQSPMSYDRSLPIIEVRVNRWYEGGALQRATLRQWLRASRRNQLATAAGWTIQTLGEAKVRQLGMEGWRLFANNLITCVNAAAVPDMMDRSVTEIVAACTILLER